jgi:hypothetical protein
MARFHVDDDAVGKVTVRHYGLAVRTVSVHDVNVSGVQL